MNDLPSVEQSDKVFSTNKRALEFLGGLTSVALGGVITALGSHELLKSTTALKGALSGVLSVATNSLAGALIGGGAIVMVDPSNTNWKEKAYKGVIAGGLVGGFRAP